MSPSLALQKLVRARLVADPAVVALVPADDITDRHGRPARFPSIVFGEGREHRLGAMKRESSRVVLDIHVWCDSPGTRQSKLIVDAIRRALRASPWSADGHAVLDLQFVSARYLPDPASADLTHSIVTFDSFMLETA
ncbi:DUF3168 domain-containing protein [Methylobacterium oxalidis]|uniref:DUF3168 domain-containing protein n=1 Tax=Methylobacterium oxalidis TaxID=944322 RepID=UPI0033159161